MSSLFLSLLLYPRNCQGRRRRQQRLWEPLVPTGTTLRPGGISQPELGNGSERNLALPDIMLLLLCSTIGKADNCYETQYLHEVTNNGTSRKLSYSDIKPA